MNVMFLCESSDLEEGLVFPNELDDDCGFPGLFVIEEKQGKLNEKYMFDAIQNGNKISITLKIYEGNTFYAQFNNDIFYFMAHPTKYSYIGHNNCLQNRNPLWILDPVNPNKLEEVCQKQDLFFVGSVQVC